MFYFPVLFSQDVLKTWKFVKYSQVGLVSTWQERNSSFLRLFFNAKSAQNNRYNVSDKWHVRKFVIIVCLKKRKAFARIYLAANGNLAELYGRGRKSLPAPITFYRDLPQPAPPPIKKTGSTVVSWGDRQWGGGGMHKPSQIWRERGEKKWVGG
jgi:hypothetical protein